MTAMTMYGLKNCDTCKKALKALAAAGHDVTFVDIRTEADLAAKVPVWLSCVSENVLINKRSTTWRGLTTAEQEGASGAKAAALLTAHPTLIKRPVIEINDRVHVGWAKDVSEALT